MARASAVSKLVSPDWQHLAGIIVHDCLGIRAGESVIVETWNHMLDLAREIVFRLREIGARPLVLLEDEEAYWRSVEKLPENKLGKVGRHEWAALGNSNVYIFLRGPADIGPNRGIHTPKLAAATAYNDRWYTVAERAGVRGVRVDLGFVTEQRARYYGFDHAAWWAGLWRAVQVDYAEMRGGALALAQLLRRKVEVRLSHPNGTELRFRLSGRRPRVDCGVIRKGDVGKGFPVLTYLPPGQVVVAPDETSVEGKVVFDRRSLYGGKWLQGIEWHFRRGRLSSYMVEKNGEAFEEAYNKQKGDKDRMGLLGIGLNPRIPLGFLHDAFADGMVRVTLGWNAEYGGRNKTDFFFGALLSGASIEVNGSELLRKGRLVI